MLDAEIIREAEKRGFSIDVHSYMPRSSLIAYDLVKDGEVVCTSYHASELRNYFKMFDLGKAAS